MEQIQTINWKNLDREQRGKLIFENGNIKKTPTGWRVISQTARSQSYIVKFSKDRPKCSCPDCGMRKKKYKKKLS